MNLNNGEDLKHQIIDLLDLINYTLSNNFIEKWRYKYSERFLKHFQLRLLKSLQDQKPIKTDTLYLFLTKKCSYSKDQVLSFFESVDIEIYQPLVHGRLTKHNG